MRQGRGRVSAGRTQGTQLFWPSGSDLRQVHCIMRDSQSLCALRQEGDVIPLGFQEGPGGSREDGLEGLEPGQADRPQQ